MLVLGHLRVGDPTPVGRELRGGVGRNGVLAQQGRGLGGDIEQAYLVVAVGVDDALAVGAPVGIALVHTGSVGDVAGHTFAGWHVKDFAACCDGQSVAVGREAAFGHVVFHVALLLACKVVLAVECDVDFAVLLAGGVELIDVAAVFKHNLAAATAGELHIIVGEIGHLGSRLGCGVVAIHVHALVAVAYEVDLVAYPHGKDVLRHIVGDVGHLLAAGVINPNVVGHAALVILPGAELSKHAIIGQLGAVGRITWKYLISLVRGELHGNPSCDGYRVDVAGIGESDLSPVGRRKSQQSSLTRPCRVRRRRNNRG